MRVIYSLHTKPIIEGRWNQGNRLEETLLMFALAILDAHLWYDDIVLYTDEIGESVLKDLPIKVKRLKEKNHNSFWVRSKIEAIADQDVPFVHMDGDVFVRRNIDFDSICDQVIVERIESEQFEKHYRGQLKILDPYFSKFDHWTDEIDYSLNCGTIGFRNLALRDKFVEAYHKWESFLRKRSRIQQQLKKDYYEPCVVLEQYNLAALLHNEGVEYSTVLKGETLEEHKKAGKDMKYIHLYGTSKYTEEYRVKIQERLETVYPYWYKKVRNNINSLKIK